MAARVWEVEWDSSSRLQQDAFSKRTDQAPERDVATAVARMKRYLERREEKQP